MNPSYGPFVSRKLALEKGLKHYFTGKPCKRGHLSVRGVNKWNCLECDRCQKTAERLRDPERVRANEKRTRTKNQKAVGARIKDWQQRNPHKMAEYAQNQQAKIQTDPAYAEKRVALRNAWWKKQRTDGTATAVANNLRCRLNNALKAKKKDKLHNLNFLNGCSIEELCSHLESLFQEGMTWENWSRDGWHIDHIRPCASFDLTDSAQQRECFHYTNLQPLWAADNIRKSDKWLVQANG